MANSNARVSQIVAQVLRTVEANYSPSTPSAQASRVAQFAGVLDVPIGQLPYSVECLNNQNFAQSVAYPTLIGSSGFVGNSGGGATNGKATLLGPTGDVVFQLDGSTSGASGLATPCMFGQYLVGMDLRGNFWSLRTPKEQDFVPGDIVISPPNSGIFQPGAAGSDVNMIACHTWSRFGSQLNLAYGGQANSALGNVVDFLQFLINPASSLVGDILTALIDTILGEISDKILVAGSVVDWTSGTSNPSLAMQCASCLAMYKNIALLVPFTSFYKVPYAAMGVADPDLYIGRHGQCCIDWIGWNTYQAWTNSGSAFGYEGPQIYDFDIDTFWGVSLDDAATNTAFQSWCDAGGSPVATPRGWIVGLSGGYGINPDTLPLLVSPDFTRWQILNFIPTDGPSTAMLVADEALSISADNNLFYVGTPGQNYMASVLSAANPVPANPAISVPQAVGCQAAGCDNSNPYYELEPWQ